LGQPEVRRLEEKPADKLLDEDQESPVASLGTHHVRWALKVIHNQVIGIKV